MQDRRVFERLAASFPAKFWDIGANSVGEAEVNDVSAAGLSFTGKTDLAAGVNLGLWLEIPDNKERLYVRGLVTWSEAAGTDTYRIGVRLARPELMGMARIYRQSVNFA